MSIAQLASGEVPEIGPVAAGTYNLVITKMSMQDGKKDGKANKFVAANIEVQDNPSAEEIFNFICWEEDDLTTKDAALAWTNLNSFFKRFGLEDQAQEIGEELDTAGASQIAVGATCTCGLTLEPRKDNPERMQNRLVRR